MPVEAEGGELLEIARAGEDLWDRAWERLPEDQRDVFARSGYYLALQAPGGPAAPECALFRDRSGLIMYPYFRCPLSSFPWLDAPQGTYDLISAYGYGGVFGDTREPELLTGFLEAFGTHCRDTGVVAELMRVNPLLGMSDLLEGFYTVQEANRQVVVDLRRTDDQIWRSYRHNNRKNVNKALRSGVAVVRENIWGERFDDFLRIYGDTMRRRSAREAFLFDDGFYRKLDAGLPGKTHVFYSLLGGETVSAELVLCSETAVYSFLGGTREDRFEFRPNNLLKHEIIRWGRDAGYSRFLLGGGPGGDDGIFEYKRSFAPEGVVDFRLAFRVHRPDLYRSLLERCTAHPPQSGEAAAAYPLRWRYGETGLV
jgi:hypothetical protein